MFWSSLHVSRSKYDLLGPVGQRGARVDLRCRSTAQQGDVGRHRVATAPSGGGERVSKSVRRIARNVPLRSVDDIAGLFARVLPCSTAHVLCVGTTLRASGSQNNGLYEPLSGNRRRRKSPSPVDRVCKMDGHNVYTIPRVVVVLMFGI